MIMNQQGKESVVCVYDDNAPSIESKILEVFERYIKSRLQNAKSS